MLEYCNKKNLNPFDYLPLTIIINFNECNENLKNFEILFENIKNYLPDTFENNIENFLYSSLFKIESNIIFYILLILTLLF